MRFPLCSILFPSLSPFQCEEPKKKHWVSIKKVSSDIVPPIWLQSFSKRYWCILDGQASVGHHGSTNRPGRLHERMGRKKSTNFMVQVTRSIPPPNTPHPLRCLKILTCANFFHTFIDPSCPAFQYHDINNQSLVLNLSVTTVPSSIGVVIIVP